MDPGLSLTEGRPRSELPLDIVIAAVPGGLIRIQLAEKMLAEIDGLADAAAAAVGEHAREGLAVNLDAGHAAAEGVLVRARRVVGIGAEHGCENCQQINGTVGVE